MIKADFHTHSNFSTDSKAAPESMIQGAIKKGLTHLCLRPNSTPIERLNLPAYFSLSGASASKYF